MKSAASLLFSSGHCYDLKSESADWSSNCRIMCVKDVALVSKEFVHLLIFQHVYVYVSRLEFWCELLVSVN